MSVSVYSGYDPTDDGSPPPAEHADDTLPDQPVSAQRDSPDGQGLDSTANLETSTQPANQQSSVAVTVTEESVGGTTEQNATLQEPVVNESLEPVSQSSVEQPSSISSSAHRLELESSHTASTKATASEGGLSGLTELPKLSIVHKVNRGDQPKKPKKRWQQSIGDNSDYVSSIDSRLRVGAKPEKPVVRYGNMLDHCNSEGSDAEVPKVVKPTAIKPSGSRTNPNLLRKRGYQSATGIYCQAFQFLYICMCARD